jgi:hypothetical protein
MYIMAGLLVVAFFANLAVRPVAEHHLEGNEGSAAQAKSKRPAMA